MINIDLTNFETDVIETSKNIPVLIDFWAPWCNPCKTIGPLLEQLEMEYQGRFVLAKINTEAVPELGQAFGIQSIPTCILMMDGRPVNGFMGAQPKAQIKAFLDQYLPSEADLVAADMADEAQTLIETDPASAIAMLTEALAQAPDNDEVRFDLIKQHISQGDLVTARTLLQPVLPQLPPKPRFMALDHWLQALEFVTDDQNPLSQWREAQFEAHLAQNKRDFSVRLAKARMMIAEGLWPAALDELLEIIMRDKKWQDEIPRKTYIALLELMTPPPTTSNKPSTSSGSNIQLAGAPIQEMDPQHELIARYRRKLSMALN